jgi:hypothetical protein
MVIRRPPRDLPGADPFLVHKSLAAVYLALVGISLALNMGTMVDLGAPRGHLPWPLAQWALTTPLGTLAVALLGGLVSGLPIPLALLALQPRPILVHPVDVTELPLAAWPSPPSFWRAPGDQSPADVWLGRSRSQRAWSLLALALATLLVMGMLAAVITASWYGFTRIPRCSPSGCSPMFTQQLTTLPEFTGLAVAFLSLLAWVAEVERRCGVWFRTRTAGLLGYIRRPGVTAEAAAATLQRYTRHARLPLARLVLVAVLALLPMFLLWSGGLLLSAWLRTQWIPA